MRKILTSTIIAADPERVWNVLTDFAAYAEWNPFMPALSGHPNVGEKLLVQIHPPGGKAMTFRPVVLVAKAGRELRWLGRVIMPGIFDGEHFFRLSETDGGTVFEQGEDFSGVLVTLIGASIFAKTERGFVAMNEALKERAEDLPGSR